MISPIEALGSLPSIGPAGGLPAQVRGAEADPADREDAVLFRDVFQYAIDNVKETDAVKTQAEYLLVTGQLDNPAVMTIASTKNQIAVDLLVQLRNKALDSYSELMRISI